jgi:putative membrane protein
MRSTAALAPFVLCTLTALICSADAASRTEKLSAPAFLSRAAQAQQVEILFGGLAAQRAGDERIKRFGARMVEDHTKASIELRQLASKTGLSPAADLNEEQERQQQALLKLSGPPFDRTYMSLMVREHAKVVKQFEKAAFGADNQEIQHWAAGSLPLLNEHHQEARALASSLAPNRTQAR